MVKLINLSDLSPEKLSLLGIIAQKISLSKHTSLNQDFDSNLKVDINVIKALLETIEARVNKVEVIYYTFLESADHASLTGATTNLPIKLEFEFIKSTSVVKENIEINERFSYKELVDLNFQHFILLVASLFENCVRLAEILVKKIIVHRPGDRPINTPMLNYISFFESLIRLGYRSPDQIFNCLRTHDILLKKILEPVNRLRNSFIHGYLSHLESDGYNYRVNFQQAPTFSSGSPDLNVDSFSRIICEGTILFIKDFLFSLGSHIKHYKKGIPA
jgi:hypothetical protein